MLSFGLRLDQLLRMDLRHLHLLPAGGKLRPQFVDRPLHLLGAGVGDADVIR